MKTKDGTCCLCARIFLGLEYIGIAAAELLGVGTGPPYMTDTLSPSAAQDIQMTIVTLMLAVTGSWLILGIRTRVMAVLGMILMLGLAWSNQYLPGNPAWTVYTLSAALATLPLLRNGGGRCALVRGGWRGLI